MLTSEIKQKIDSARNILVGKIPTPTGQVEQITLALIYKFMNDIDDQNKELGGKLKFFTGQYSKYAWKNLIDKSLSAYERVTSYGEGLERMHLNPNLPQFFRNVFRGAFLPFRDPEVLTIFLKQIDEFRYGVNGDLGDAFEYLLQVMGTQGDAGQFLTPRHHINFIVSVVDPQKTDKTLDPAEGTAGFLISAYLHILKQNTKPGSDIPGSALTYDERKKLSENFVGYDISHDMVRLSLVNLYLHGFADPRIYEYDTLGNLDRWDDDFDCILTNPPFMTPRGGVKPHKRFSIQAKRSEVLFVDYIMEHLNPNGKAGIIVPEGIIFKSATAERSLRKMLIDQNFLYAVVSLPAGIFQPYSGVKTSILFMDRVIAKKTKNILFVKIENDGFDLGAQRRPIEKNDLPRAAEILKRYKMSIQTGKPFVLSEEDKQFASLVPIEKIGKSGDYNLSADRYKETIALVNQKWPMVELGEVTEILNGYSFKSENYVSEGIRVIRITNVQKGRIVDDNPKFYAVHSKEPIKNYELYQNDLLISLTGNVGRIGLLSRELLPAALNQRVACLRTKDERLESKYLFYLLNQDEFENECILSANGVAQKNMSTVWLTKYQIPLPPLEVQQEIVSHLDSYQKIIDGAKQVVDNYKPEIKIDPEWPRFQIGVVAEIDGRLVDPKCSEYASLPHVSGENIESGNGKLLEIRSAAEDRMTSGKYLFDSGCVLYSKLRPYLRKAAVASFRGLCSADMYPVRTKPNLLIPEFLLWIFLSEEFSSYANGVSHRARMPKLNRDQLFSYEIPLPPLDIQKEIVSMIEEEQQLVDATKKLIQLYQGKIKEKINEVWGE
jgi:type I restriction enzyme M protein